MDQRIDMLERDVSELKTEIAVIRGDYSKRENLKGLEERVASVDARLTVIEARMTALESKFSALESRMAAFEVRLVVLERELGRLRDEITTVVDLLRQHSESLAVIETGVAQIQATYVTKAELDAQLKAELSKLEARMKTWAIASVLTTITAITGIQLAIATLIR